MPLTVANLHSGPAFQKDHSPIPPTYLEQKRHEAQLLYQEEKAYIAANKDNFAG